MAVCLSCDMEVEVKADGRPVRIGRCPICAGRLCTCSGEGNDGHQADCPLFRNQAPGEEGGDAD